MFIVVKMKKKKKTDEIYEDENAKLLGFHKTGSLMFG